MRWKLECVIEPEDDGYVSHCEELGVASQGETGDEAKRNLEEAMEMLLEDASQNEILSLLGNLKPESPVGIRHRTKISVLQHQEEQGTKWEIVVA